MKRERIAAVALLAVTALGSAFGQPNPGAAPGTDVLTAASGQYYYAASSYSPEALAAALKSFPYPGSVTVATVNEDGTPNLAVAIPALSADGKYLSFGLADNRTKTNMIKRLYAVVCVYEYNPRAENKADRNKGARIILSYPGDEENKSLNAGKERPALFMRIVKILPLG